MFMFFDSGRREAFPCPGGHHCLPPIDSRLIGYLWEKITI